MAECRYTFLDLGPVNAPYMDELADAAARVVRSGRYIGGPEVDAFEHNLCALTGARYAVGVSNGLDALRLILRAYVELGVFAPGDEVIVPANTYIASVLAISDAGLVAVLAEPDLLTSNLDTSRLAELVTPRTKAVMPVHLYGRVCWDETLRDFALGHGLKIIEDNAQAIGADAGIPGLSGGRRTGALGHAAAFSFYPTKNTGALGDAGAVTTCDERLAATVRALANYGSDRRYHNIYRGFNCRLDPMQAAILNVKPPYVAEENALRRQLAGIYCSMIDNPFVRLPELVPGHVFHQFVVHTPRRDDFCRWLDANGVGWDIHYAVPPHMQPCYSGEDAAGICRYSALPVTEELARTCISLPITRCTSPQDAGEIAGIINGFN